MGNSHYSLVIAAARRPGRALENVAPMRPGRESDNSKKRADALAALVADTDRGVPELARLKVGALHLDGEARVELADGPCPLGDPTVQILARWLSARAAIIGELQGSDPGHLWIPTKPGLTRAAVRTLHASHRTLASRVLGTPLRPGAFRGSGQPRSRSSQGGREDRNRIER